MGRKKVSKAITNKSFNATGLQRHNQVARKDGMELSRISFGTTDDATANKFIEYEVDVYFITNSLNYESAKGDFFPSRQLNIDLSVLPGVDRGDDSVNKRPFLVEGRLYARPLWEIGNQTWNVNPNIWCGRLVTTLGTDMGSLGETDDIALYDNTIFNLEPNVNQDYVQVVRLNYLKDMPGMAPASRKVLESEVTNLLCLGLVNPDGTVYTGDQVAFRFVLTYRVPVVLQSTASFLINRGDDDLPEDGILALARNLKDVIAPSIKETNDFVNQEQAVFPDAKRVLKQN